MALFSPVELGDWLELGGPADTERHTVVERVVWGWLKPILGLTERPDPVPDEVFSWAIELGAIAHENPDGRTAYQLGNERSQYSWERRNAILAEASNAGQPAGSTASPSGRFPKPCPWPDPPRTR